LPKSLLSANFALPKPFNSKTPEGSPLTLKKQIMAEKAYEVAQKTQHITIEENEPATQSTLRIPNLFIVGASKAGSTALWYMLKQHSKIYMPQEELYKEPCFFSPSGNLAKYTLEDYLNLYKDASSEHLYIGDTSTPYITDPMSASLIKACSPDAKIIIILRNPIDRAYSLYNWMRQEGYEWAKTFEEALQLEKSRRHKSMPSLIYPNYKYNYLYYESGCYAEQVKRYIDLFDKNVLVLVFKDLKQKPKETLNKIYDFLELPFEPVKNEIRNPSFVVRSAKLQYLLRYATTSKMAFQKKILKKDRFTKAKRDSLLRLGIKEERPPKIDPSTYKRLVNAYKKDITYLQKITGMDFSFWLNSSLEKSNG
jgi:hypothetical protein